MALSTKLAAYEDCEALFDHALNDSLGARALFPTESSAAFFRMRMNNYRVLLRKEAERIYPADSPQWGKSIYDSLLCRMMESAEADGSWWVYVERHGQTILAVESLSGSTEPTASRAVLKLEGKVPTFNPDAFIGDELK